VMYLGKIVEEAPAEEIYRRAQHPYTQVLLASVPGSGRLRATAAVRGEIASGLHPPSGCRFHPRCPLAEPVCREVETEIVAGRVAAPSPSRARRPPAPSPSADG